MADCKHKTEDRQYIDVTNHSFGRKPSGDKLIREFNRGKSFEFQEWKSMTKYTNDSFTQDFVVYKGAFLACKKTHVSKTPPILTYSDSGELNGVTSPEWTFVFATGTNKYYLEGDLPYGVPVYTEQMYTNLDPKVRPDRYIKIRDFEEEITEEESKDNYLDILFSAIRKLQAEVAKLRNSFKYGINSYTNIDTAVSGIIDDNILDEEPLWAVDQSDLSGIASAMFDFESGPFSFKPESNYSVYRGYISVKEESYFDDEEAEVKNCQDPKLYLYTTSSSLNYKYVLKKEDGQNITIDLNSLVNVNQLDKYNVLFVLSRKTRTDTDSEYRGFNYAWISISNHYTNEILVEGYYNHDKNILDNVAHDFGITTPVKIAFNQMLLYKFDMYSKYQDFSSEVIPSTPSDQDYKYRVAHLTIRAVKNYGELETIVNYLPDNELIWEETSRKLYIKSKGVVTPIGVGGDPDKPNTGMTETEVLELLEKMGIVYSDENGLQLSPIGDATFIHNDTGKAFKFEVDSKGELRSTEIPELSLSTRVDSANISEDDSDFTNFRGFIAKLHCAENNIDVSSTKDIGLNSDRVKIGAVYCPLITDVKHGCSHGFIELENTSDKDIPLEGMYLHYLHPGEGNASIVEHLGLKGILKSGSTYLIRCKKYADVENTSDVFVQVDSYDQEWYVNKELLDLSNDGTSAYGFALTYEHADLAADTQLFTVNTEDSSAKTKYRWAWYFIDSLVLNKSIGDNTQIWAINEVEVKSNSIIKNTFELDPAKQAFQALTTCDSSRRRGEKLGTDIQILNLDNQYIEFPNSDEKYPVSKFTPRSSKYSKNVSTDKTSFDLEKPNIINCSFGIDTYTTRCFNWVSAGSFDEYVFLKNSDGTWTAFESYKEVDEAVSQSETYPCRKEFSKNANNMIYSRISKTFPGCNINYTAHKCVVKVVASEVSEKTEYTYVVGRMSKEKTPDFEHCSEEHTFTLYPTSYTPRIYQITDQQGFHWIEYQVWAAAAKKLNEKIISDVQEKDIIPVLINTGDVTQNGTRINEWLDYHSAGKCLFNHLEQMNVVGNNDLCGTDPEILGTGNDDGKSNGFYFHVFHCYDIDETITTPIINGKYIPSLYYFDFDNLRCLMVNSEITKTTCEKWYKTVDENNNIFNIYTGWGKVNDTAVYKTDVFSEGEPIYNMIYKILNSSEDKNVIAVCHEMPFTVITDACLSTNKSGEYRSYSSGSLVGSHLNQLHVEDTVGIYWFSRLLEHFGVKLCIGGHKHTYASTFPVRENYSYEKEGSWISSITGPMEMPETLEKDNCVLWITDQGINTTKYPLVNTSLYKEYTEHNDENYIHPINTVDGMSGGVVYFMCQATGYKLTSNKELPSNYQEFSNMIPQTKEGSTADDQQKESMFAIIDLNTDNSFEIKLAKVKNIFNNKYKFSQSAYSADTPYLNYATKVEGSRFCEWGDESSTIITVE